MTSNTARALKGLITTLLAFAVVLVVPVLVLKWGQAHPRFHWHDWLHGQGDHDSVGSLSSLFSLSFPWQEKASLSACLATAAYLGFALGLNVDCAGPRRKWQVLIKDPEWLFALGSYAFLFLYTAATALCQRTSMGTVGGSEMIVEIYRDLGLALLAFCLIVLTRLLVKASSFNGMIVRKDVERAYRLLLGAAGALAICFATWFPLIALPGAWIMTKWCLGILAAIETTHEDEETGEDEVRKPALS